MTIRRKLFGWFLVPVLLVVILGIVTFLNSRKIDENIKTLIEEDWTRADSIMELRIGLGILGCSVTMLAEAFTHEDKEKIKDTIIMAHKLETLGNAKFMHGFEKLVKLENQGADIFKLNYTTAELKQRYDTIIDASDRMEKMFLAGDAATGKFIKDEEFVPRLSELQLKILEESEEFADAIVENSEKAVTQFTAKTTKTSIFLGTIAVFAGIVYSIIISRVISKPIIKLRNTAIKIGKGKFDGKLEIKSQDEFAQLADSLNQMNINTKKYTYDLRQSEEKYRDLIENSSELIYQTDKERFFVEANRTMSKKLGLPPEVLKKMRIEDIVPSNKRVAIVEHVRKVIETGNDSIETIFLAKNGEELYVEINAASTYDSNNNITKIRAFAHDISGKKKSETKEKHERDLQLLSSQIVMVQEEEKRKISRELHDITGQALTAVKFNIEMLDSEISSALSPKNKQRFVETKQLLSQALNEICSLSFGLRPPLLDYYGILVAIKGYSRTFSERTNLDIKVHSKNIEAERFPTEIEILLYRCAQEALNNVAKHSEAKNVSIYLAKGDHELLMKVKDDGKGFDVEKHFKKDMDSSSIGLFSMRERIAHVGGKLRINSEKNVGTVLEISVPLVYK